MTELNDKKANEKVKWGILGCANIANKAVIPGIKSAGNAELYAVASRDREKAEDFRNRHNAVKAYDSYEKLLEDPEVDAVYIPLPNGLHREWVMKAAEKGKHILCEKPLGISSDEVREMESVCKKNCVKLMEAFAFRHSPLTFKVRELLDNSIIGKVKLIEAWFSFKLSNPGNVRLIRELGGGSVYDVGCYTINIIRHLAGSEPVKVMAAGEISPESGVDESCCMLFEFKDGLRAMSHCSFNSAYRSGYRMTGETGIIDVDVPFNSKGDLSIRIHKDNKTEIINMSVPDNYMLEVEQFGRYILNGEAPPISLEDSYNNAVVIDRVLEQIDYKVKFKAGF